jgi:hypothetical protein
MSGSFGEVLSYFKKSESPENIFPLLNDVALCNALIAWKSVTVEFTSSEECPYDDDKQRWEWMWGNVKFDVATYGVVAGCKAQDAAMMINRLKGLHLIFPDGTISNYAKTYLSQLILQKAQGKGRKEKPAAT